jgi:hypothetical protein
MNFHPYSHQTKLGVAISENMPDRPGHRKEALIWHMKLDLIIVGHANTTDRMTTPQTRKKDTVTGELPPAEHGTLKPLTATWICSQKSSMLAQSNVANMSEWKVTYPPNLPNG